MSFAAELKAARERRDSPPARKYREVRVRCYGIAESGPFAELENGGRIYGLTAAAPAMLAALEQILAGDATGWRETWNLADVIQKHYAIARKALQLAK